MESELVSSSQYCGGAYISVNFIYNIINNYCGNLIYYSIYSLKLINFHKQRQMKDQQQYKTNKYNDFQHSVKSHDQYSPTYESSKLYSSQKFSHEDVAVQNSQKPQVSAAQLFVNLTSSLDGLFSKIQALKEVHVTDQHVVRPIPKKIMDVSNFPMPNLSNNQFLKNNVNKSSYSKVPVSTVERKQAHVSFDDKKAISPPTEPVNYHTNGGYKFNSNNFISSTPGHYSNYENVLSSSSSLGKIDFAKNYDDYESNLSSMGTTNKHYSDFGTNLSNNSGNLSPTSPLKYKQEEHYEPISIKVHEEPKQLVNPFESSFKTTDKTIQNSSAKNAFHQNNNSFSLNKLMSHGLMSMPNLKVSMEISDHHYLNTQSENTNTLKLDSIIEKETRQSGMMVKKSIIFNQASLRDFELGKLVGSGKFGDVHICRHKETGTMFALKKIFKSTILEYNMVNQFTREIKIHYQLNHPNIIKLYSHFDDEYHVFLLMEYAEGGILMDKLKCAEDIASQFVDQTIDAVQYLHKLKIAHRDIKPQNIVLQFGSTIKLCDFGWASFYENEMKTTFCGTLDYLSPQMKQKGQYDNSVDIWSIGVLTFELLTGNPPYRKQLMLSMKNNPGVSKPGSRKINWNVNYPPYMSPLAESFIRNLLKEDPQQRAPLRFCSNHTFIKKYQQPLQSLSHFEQFNRII